MSNERCLAYLLLVFLSGAAALYISNAIRQEPPPCQEYEKIYMTCDGCVICQGDALCLGGLGDFCRGCEAAKDKP